MLIAHRIRLDPNNKQATYFAKASGVARFAYNWALAQWSQQYEVWKADHTLTKPTETALRRQLNAIKRQEFPWMLEVTKNAPQMAIMQLGVAFKNFFAKRAKYPKFRKKGVHDRFTLTNDQFEVDGSRIRIPNLGWVRMRESLRFSGKILSATLVREADRWFVSIAVDTCAPLKRIAENQGIVGVDLGILSLATLSTGEVVAGAKPHQALLIKQRRLSRSLSRKQKGSKNRDKAKLKLSRLHARIKDIRQDSLHQLTHQLTNRFETIVIEDLNVRGMIKNRHLSRAISDMGFYEFRRQLEYKAHMRGNIVWVADRMYPSSKLCSCCGHLLEELSLSIRKWQCPICENIHDRDVNAARNLRSLAVSSTVTACGEVSAGFGCKTKVKLTSMKQEFNAKAM